MDFLIVGLGLAGGLLAWELRRRDADIAVVDNDHHSSASLAAAGLVTPVTGKRLVLQENAGALLAEARALYRELGDRLGGEYFFPLPLLRLFADGEQLAYYARRCEDPDYAEFLGPPATSRDLSALHTGHGGAWFRQTGYLDTPALIDALHVWLAGSIDLRRGTLDYEDLEVENGAIRWRDIRARRVVFCEGYRACRNPWFKDLPWQAAKGEILSLSFDSAPIPRDAIINWGEWLAPRRDGSYRLGATHEWQRLDGQITAKGRRILLDSLHARLPGVKVRVLDQVAGVRPATRDRQPFIGAHAASPNLAIFNGFGAKGSLLVPWYAQRMAEHLCHGAPLPPEADIRRHGKG